MSEQSWHLARLIPTSGIEGADEQERRATSALLAVLGAVGEFRRAVTAPLGAPTGTVETFVEVPFIAADGKFHADGLIRIKGGGQTWTALVEVKTGSGRLDVRQLLSYLDVAEQRGFAVVLTISNDVSRVAGQHPVAVDRRRLGAVQLHHYSWSHLLAEAVMQKEHHGVADPDQAWLLGELIRYLEHPRSGALEFDGCYVEVAQESPKRTRPLMNPEGKVNVEVSMKEQRSIDVTQYETGTVETTIPASRSVSLEPAVRTPPVHPSRREVRLARHLEFGEGENAAAPEAGWYQDPGDDGQLRWYDGSAWSERTYPVQPALA